MNFKADIVFNGLNPKWIYNLSSSWILYPLTLLIRILNIFNDKYKFETYFQTILAMFLMAFLLKMHFIFN